MLEDFSAQKSDSGRCQLAFGNRRRLLHVGRAVRHDGQLQYGRALTFGELRYQHPAAIRKFDRIMVTVRNMRVDRAEFSDPEFAGSGPNPAIVVSDAFGEGEFSSWKHADRYFRLVW
jgi:hypothetical protein